MNCKTVRPLLSEFMDDQLDAAAAWQVQTHLADCAACRRTSRDLEMLRVSLQALPVQQPSAQFDAALAQRLALTRRPAAPSRQPLTVQVFGSWFKAPASLVRPALALSCAAFAGAAVLFAAMPPAATAPHPAAVRADHTFVADCLAQRRRDAAGEPLADLSAQNLAGRLDSSSDASLDTSSDSSSATPASDAGIF